MPFATFTRVREVSSEDNIHLAENLIRSHDGKKWKAKTAGEKSAYVILEMADCYQITGIDIGNEHSAFVEVLVGKSVCAPEEFKEILITCSFMTPIESKSSNNINRVRCFGRDALVPTVAEEKWSLIKILCTQPFNKHVAYGLSFIKVHIIDNTNTSSTGHKNLVPNQLSGKVDKIVGKLKFREDSPDSENENNLTLFDRWKKSKHIDEEQTTAASIRMAAKNSLASARLQRHCNDEKQLVSLSLKKDDILLDRNREELLFGEETEAASNKNQEKLKRLSEQIDLDKKRRDVEKEKEINNKKKKSQACSPKSSDNVPKTPSSSKQLAKNSSSNNILIKDVKEHPKLSTENPMKKIKLSKSFRPFNQLLKDVVLVISGIQNPDRGELRNKAIAMGAKYKADWDSTCTHLICAFKNTPKYNQVKGRGKIVARSWIEKCYDSKMYLPWRRYALDSKDLSKPESDEEILDDGQNSEIKEVNNCIDSQNTSLCKSRAESEERNNTLALYGLDDKPSVRNQNSSTSESDTDDEIERIQEDIKITKVNIISKVVDIYEASTDEEDYIAEKRSK